MDYTIKNVKSFQGNEGYGFSCSLYRNKKRIGVVTDTANGGMIDFYLVRDEEKILDSFCKTLPKWGSEFGDKEYDTDKEIFVTNLVSVYEKEQSDKKLRKKCKTMTLFTLKTDKKKNSYWVMGIPFNDITKAKLEKKYRKDNIVFLNETLNK